MPYSAVIRLVPGVKPESLQSGDIVSVAPNNTYWGKKIVLPNWGILTINDQSVRAGLPLQACWWRRPQIKALPGDAFAITSEYLSADGRGGMGFKEVSDFCSSWGLNIKSQTPANIVFDFDLSKVIKSFGFWGANRGELDIKPTMRDQPKDRMFFTVSHRRSSHDTGHLTNIAIVRQADVVDSQAGAFVVELTKERICDELRRIIMDLFTDCIAPRRYCVGPSLVKKLITSKGSLAIDFVAFSRNLINKAPVNG